MPKKHLTKDDRVRIETYLNERQSLRYIAERLDKSPSTISREISSHASEQKCNSCDCIYFYECKKTKVCGNSGNSCHKQCRTCVKARKYCSDYSRAYCDYMSERKIPLCNGCSKVYNCHFTKRRYIAAKAEKEYRNTLINSRNGFDLTGEQLIEINDTVSPLIKKGQSLYHIAQSNNLPVSESTLRRLVGACELDARNIDLRNTVKRRVRHVRPRNYKVMSVIKDGHKYSDFLEYIKDNPVSIVQMDCVEGKSSDKAALLTLYFPVPHMQLAVIINEHTSDGVIHALDMIEESLGKELFTMMFPLILTDNGHEFADIEGVERSLYGGKRTKVFYCEPNHPEQKGGCEKNHEFIRYVIPKGKSLEPYSQQDISLMMDHINSYKRKDLYGKSPYETAMALFPTDFFILLGLTYIDPKEVNLSPSLIRKSE